jgi:WD40-like Beta Propeller Repeat
MDETSLRALFEGAVASRPQTPDLVARSVRTGRRLRTRRRLVAGTALVAAIAAISAAPLAYGAYAHIPHHRPPSGPSFAAGTGYIPVVIRSGRHFRNAIVPLTPDNSKLGQPILLPGNGMWALQAGPDGEILYTIDNQGQLTPVDLATRKAEPSITLPTRKVVPAIMLQNDGVNDGSDVSGGSFVITPDDRHAYVGLPGAVREPGQVIPVNLGSRRVGRPIPTPANTYVTIDPNGHLAYAIPQGWLKDPERIKITPISLTARRTLATITLTPGYPEFSTSMTFSPDGRTAYVCSVSTPLFRSEYVSVMPINTATDTPLPRIVWRIPAPSYETSCSISFSEDGRTAFVAAPGDVFPVDVATGKAEAAIRLPATRTEITWVSRSDGRYVYAVGVVPGPGLRSEITIVPIDTSTRAALALERVSVSDTTASFLCETATCFSGWNEVTVAPDGVAYIGVGYPVSLRSGGYNSLIPVSLATGRRERPLTFRGDLGTALTIYPR